MRVKAKQMKNFFQKRKKLLLILLVIIIIIGFVFAAVKYYPFSGNIKSDDQVREEIMGMSQELDDLSKNIESIDEELK